MFFGRPEDLFVSSNTVWQRLLSSLNGTVVTKSKAQEDVVGRGMEKLNRVEQ
jgi:predicted nucleotide-binding protein (sugar kinase/HSP70/actin superfamily)